MVVSEVVSQDEVDEGCLANLVILQTTLAVCLQQCLSDFNEVACSLVDSSEEEQEETVKAIEGSFVGLAYSLDLGFDNVECFSIVFLTVKEEGIECLQIGFDFRQLGCPR